MVDIDPRVTLVVKVMQDPNIFQSWKCYLFIYSDFGILWLKKIKKINIIV